MNAAEQLARKLSEYERRLRGVERGSQLSRSSIEAGTLAINDESGSPVLSVGLQPDGGYAVVGTNGGQVVATDLDLPDGSITETLISDDAISTPKLRANAVTTDKVAAGAIEALQIAANAITAGKIAANAVTAGTIAANAVTAGTIAANAVTASAIAADAITGKTITGGLFQTAASGNRISIGNSVINGTAPAIRWNSSVAGSWGVVTDAAIYGQSDDSTYGRYIGLKSGHADPPNTAGTYLYLTEEHALRAVVQHYTTPLAGRYLHTLDIDIAGLKFQYSNPGTGATSSFAVGSAGITSNGVAARMLVASDVVNSTGGLDPLTTTQTDIPGCTASITTTRANAKVAIRGSFDMNMKATNGAIALGVCMIDGVAQARTATYAGATNGARATVTGVWRATIAAPGTYTIKLRASATDNTSTRCLFASMDYDVFE
ncbi:hypothetical protein AB0H43_03045 [Hamadaea sp. NPDC050747]|uniref:hypothetical protein n=1 Tax=Hamadaea sp. NPDC050747 TaxID=3155789 RepID=UPI0033FDD783